MKKILELLLAINLITTPVFSVTSCSDNTDWHGVETPDPIMTIKQEGFSNIHFDSLSSEIGKMQNTDELINRIQEVVQSKYELDKLLFTWYRNDELIGVEPTKTTFDDEHNEDNFDRYRIGLYELVLTNSKNSTDKASFIIYVKQSKYLPDIINTNSLGQIADIRPKSILIGLIMKNMNLIPSLDDLARTFIDPKTGLSESNNLDLEGSIVVEQNKNVYNATISTRNKPQSDCFYGTIKTNFEVLPIEENEKYSKKIEELVIDNGGQKNDSGNYDLGKFNIKNPKTDHYVIIMWFITKWFVSWVGTPLSILINDIDVENIDVEQVQGNQSNKWHAKISVRQSPQIPEYKLTLKESNIDVEFVAIS